MAQVTPRVQIEAQDLGQSLLAWVESEGHTTEGAIQIWMMCTTTYDQGVFQAQASAEGQAWVQWPCSGQGLDCHM